MGAYALNTSIFDVQVAIAIGILGFLFRRFGMPITPLILGLILGPNLELQFRRALQISAGDYGTLWASPLSKILYLVLIHCTLYSNYYSHHAQSSQGCCGEIVDD